MHEALINHSRKYFNTSIILITINTEGIIKDFLRLFLNSSYYRISEAIKHFKHLMNKNNGISDYEILICEAVLNKIEEIFTTHFDCNDPDSTPNLSRDKMSHGFSYNKETEEHSLKAFLYLNEIYNMISRYEQNNLNNK